MKPPPFDYVRATSVAEAVHLLSRHDGEAKILAGGQSLMPMLNFRLLAPELLIDIRHISALNGIRVDGETVHIGATTRHRDLLESDVIRSRFPALTEAMRHVAHLAIRNRGTIGGSISHADPAAELPMMLCLLDAVIHVEGPGGGRQVTASDFFQGTLTTDLTEDEMVTSIELPGLPPRMGWGFAEIARRHGDFAIAGAAALLTLTDGRISDARLAVMGVDEVPLRITPAEIALNGHEPTEALYDTAIRLVRETVQPNDDLHGSADYRRHLVGILSGRVLRQAVERAA